MSEQQDIKINTLEINYSNMAEKIEKLETTVKDGFKDVMSELKSFKKEADEKYANKSVEKEVADIKDKQEMRTYDWLKYSIATAILVIMATLSFLVFGENILN